MCLGPELVTAATAAAEGIGGALSAAAPYAATVAAGSQLAGAYAHSRSANAQNEAQQRALEANRQKQHALQEEANQAILGTAKSFDPAAQQPQLQAEQQARTAAAAPTPIPTQGYQTTTASAPKVVESDQERKMAEALTSGREAATRSGALQGYADTAQKNNIAIGRAGQRVGQLANFSHGQSNTLPFQLQTAYDKGGNWGEAGSILDSIGRLGTLYGVTRKPKPGVMAAGGAAGGSPVYDEFGELVQAI